MADSFRVALAWTLLHVMSVSLAVLGFDRTLRFAMRPPPQKRRRRLEASDRLVDAVARAIGRAKRWHLRLTPNDCLPVSLAGVCLLRRGGVSARLGLGVTRYPFSAHAWVVVGDHVIDFPPNKYQAYYAVTPAGRGQD